MAVLRKCLFPILLLASLISLAAAARNIPLHIDDHSVSVSASPPNHDHMISSAGISRSPPDDDDSVPARNIPLHIDDHSVSVSASPPNHDHIISSVGISRSPPDDDDSVPATGVKRPRPPDLKLDQYMSGFSNPHTLPKLDDDHSSISTMTPNIDGEREHDSTGTSGDAIYGSSKWYNGWGNGWGWGNNGYNYGWGNGRNGYGDTCTGTCYGGVCSGTCYNSGGWGSGWVRTKQAASDALNSDAVPPEAAKGNSPADISEVITNASEEIGTWPGITSP